MKAYVKNIGLNDNRVNALLSTYHCQFAPIRAERGRRTIFLLSMDTDFLHTLPFSGPVFTPQNEQVSLRCRIAVIWLEERRLRPRFFVPKDDISPDNDNVQCYAVTKEEAGVKEDL